MTHVLLLNGPPGCGKDFAANALGERLGWDRTHHDKFARKVKEAVHAAYGIFVNGTPAPYDWFEERKEQPCSELFGATPRSVYIAFSEVLMKPLHGKDIFGRLLLRDLLRINDKMDTIIISDSGFLEEAKVLVDYYGPKNVSLVHLHRHRCTFDGDSRSFVLYDYLGLSYASEVYNHGDSTFIETLIERVPYLKHKCRTPIEPSR